MIDEKAGGQIKVVEQKSSAMAIATDEGLKGMELKMGKGHGELVTWQATMEMKVGEAEKIAIESAASLQTGLSSSAQTRS